MSTPEPDDASTAQPASERMTPASRRVLAVAFVTIFLDLVGFGLIIPIQPFYAETFGATATQVTWLGGTYSLMQFLFAPFWGRLSDRFGRRPVILTSIAFGMVGYVAFGLSASLGLLFAARAVSGFGNANIGTVQAVIADVTSTRDRAKGMGLLGAAFGLGFILGPALGGAFGQLGLAAPAFAAAGLAVINWVLAFFILPETHPRLRSAQLGLPVVEASATRRPRLSILALRSAVLRPGARRLLLIFFIITTGMALMEQTLGLFIERIWVPLGGASLEHAKHAAALTTYVLLVVGVVAVIMQGGLVGPLSRRFGEKRLIIVGLVLVAASLLLIPVSGTTAVYGLLLVAGAIMAAGSGLTSPSVSSLLSKAAADDEQGGMMGLGQSMSALGRVAGPLAAGPLFEHALGLPFWCGAGLILAAASVALTLPSARPHASRNGSSTSGQ